MGQLISSAERSALSPSRKPGGNRSSDMGYGKKTSRMFDMGKRIGERAVMGRYYVGLHNSGPQMGSHIMRGMLRASQMRFDPRSIMDTFSIARFLVGSLTTVAGPHYSTSTNCGNPETHVSGKVNWSSCSVSEWVVANADMNQSLNARTVCTWKYLRPYPPNPAFSYFAPSKKWTKPLGWAAEKVEIIDSTAPRYVPSTGLSLATPPAGSPMGWAPGFSAPANHPAFNSGNAPETFYETGAPWKVGQSAFIKPAPVPLPGVQVITPTPNPPTTTPGVGPSRQPGKRTRERKFAGKKLMLRLLRLSLAVGEGLDGLDAIYKAIPKDKSKACRKAARERYYRNKREGAGWGTVNWQLLPQEKAACIYANLDHMDLNHVFYNLVKNQIEDLWAGWQYAAIDAPIKSGRGRGGGDVTKNPYEHSPLKLPEWDDPFWDEVEDYMESKGL